MNGYFGFRLPRKHHQVSCRASCPLDSGYCRDIHGRGYQLVFGSAIRASCNRFGPSGLNGLEWIMLSIIFGLGRVDQSGPSSRVGLGTREGQYSSQQCILFNKKKN
jgi:hypothetical protein